MSGLRIACIGWGSLLWDPRTLPMAEPFTRSGPRLPIEFSRVSQDGRVTLVVDREATPIDTYCVRMSVDRPEAAVEALALREKVARERVGDWIGLAVAGRPQAVSGQVAPDVRSTIEAWLEVAPYDAVVWTALPFRTPEGDLERPELARLIAHLDSLAGTALERAEQYVRRAPDAVRTANRERFETRFGWTPIGVEGAWQEEQRR